MINLSDLAGILACGTPVILFVTYMAWATRRPRCMRCNRALPTGEQKCPVCDADQAMTTK